MFLFVLCQDSKAAILTRHLTILFPAIFHCLSILARNKIYTGVRREPDGGKLSPAVDGPDVCRQQARQTKFPKVARRLPSTGPTSAVNGPDRQIPKGSPTSTIDVPDVCCRRTRRLPSTGPTNKLKQCLLSTGPTSAVNGPDVCCQRARQTNSSNIYY